MVQSMSFFNALVREFFNHDPFNSMPTVQMQPAMQPRAAPSVQMTQMTQMVESMMLNGDAQAQPKLTVHRTSRSMHNLNHNGHRSSRTYVDRPQPKFREENTSNNCDRIIELDSSGNSSQLKAITFQYN